MALDQSAQVDFAAGMFPGSIARHLIPQNGAYDIENGLLHDDGSVFERGGDAHVLGEAFGTALRFICDGFLVPGRRTLIANTEDFGVLDGADPEGTVNLGLGGMLRPRRAVELGGLLFVGGGTIYGGSRKTAVYSTGTVTVTLGSKVVAGAGTAWSANIDAGGLFKVGTKLYPVASVDSDTQLTLADAFGEATAAGAAYSVSPILAAAAPYKTSDIYAVAARRLFALHGRRIDFSRRDDPFDYTDPASGTEAFHVLPEGSEVIGAWDSRDSLLIFATTGMWELSGIPFNIVDDLGNDQHRLQHVAEELILVNHEGIAPWGGRLVVPCTDAIWLVDPVSGPTRISDPIVKLWRDYVAQGARAGLAAVYRSHLFLPVLDELGEPLDMLVCRLDRQIQTRVGVVRPWTRLSGHPANAVGLAVRTGGQDDARNPRLLAGLEHGHVSDLTGIFTPGAGNEVDADGSEYNGVIVTRDYPVKDGFGLGTVKKIRVRYELAGLPGGIAQSPIGGAYWDDALWDDALWDELGVEPPPLPRPDPKIYLDYNVGQGLGPDAALWDVSAWDVALWPSDDDTEWERATGFAPEDDGRHPHVFRITKKGRFIRYRLTLSDPARKMVLRSIETFSRHSNKA